jgi:uncharacterized protein YjiS (DUF1127 family)
MTLRFASQDPSRPSATPDLAAIRAAAARARDAEIARLLRGAFGAVASALRWLFATVADWRARNEAYQRLRHMSDRELADIGLTRDQIARVFDPAFGEAATPAAPAPRPAVPAAVREAPGTPANDAAPTAARAA